jgi:hypothetical protein
MRALALACNMRAALLVVALLAARGAHAQLVSAVRARAHV